MELPLSSTGQLFYELVNLANLQLLVVKPSNSQGFHRICLLELRFASSATSHNFSLSDFRSFGVPSSGGIGASHGSQGPRVLPFWCAFGRLLVVKQCEVLVGSL